MGRGVRERGDRDHVERGGRARGRARRHDKEREELSGGSLARRQACKEGGTRSGMHIKGAKRAGMQ